MALCNTQVLASMALNSVDVVKGSKFIRLKRYEGHFVTSILDIILLITYKKCIGFTVLSSDRWAD